MKQELQNKLFEKYPKIFSQKDLSAQETAMCWGVTCGDGWYTLIDTLCGNIKNRVDNFNRFKPEEAWMSCQATQVKEKYGGLRFYTEGGDDEIDGMISMAESMSYHICSECAKPSVPQKGRGWIYTLCSECQAERELGGK